MSTHLTKEGKKPSGRGKTPYTDAEKQDALVLWLAWGSAARVSRHSGVARETLKKWKEEDPVRWEKLKETYKSQLDSAAINTMRTQNAEMLEIRQQLIDRMAAEIPKLSPDRIPEAIGRITLAFAQSYDKLRLGEDKPTATIEYRPAKEIAREFETLLKDSIEGTAVELPESTEKASA